MQDKPKLDSTSNVENIRNASLCAKSAEAARKRGSLAAWAILLRVAAGYATDAYNESDEGRAQRESQQIHNWSRE